MYRHILIPTDGSDLAGQAAAHGLRLAKHCAAKVTIVVVTEPPGFTTPPIRSFLDAYEKAAAEHADQILESVREFANASGVACSVLHIKDDYAADGIINAAKDGECDLIVMGSHGRRGLTKLLLGSETLKVLTRTTVPVLVIP
jgi:nucleotide-binding universal stress UspA family protein